MAADTREFGERTSVISSPKLFMFLINSRIHSDLWHSGRHVIVYVFIIWLCKMAHTDWLNTGLEKLILLASENPLARS